MTRALAPWVVTLALVLGVLIAAVNSTLLDVVAWLVIVFVVLPVLLVAMRRRGTVPPFLDRMTQRGDDGRPRFPGF